MKKWPTPKDPDEVLDYEIDWSTRLVGNTTGSNDVIVTSTWTVPTGITMDDENFDDTSTVIWLSGGTEGQTYEFLNRITTRDGRTLDQSVKLPVKSR